ncbi:MAG: MOSC N-terminal beta barrel domain-containing protein [Chloroflexota bacterium]
MHKVGVVKEIWIYPVKSMAGLSVRSAELYWYGLGGDRRYAYVQEGNNSSFPWLTAREMPKLVQYQPSFADEAPDKWHRSTLHVKTPAGSRLGITDSALLSDINQHWSKPVRLIQQNRGSFDAAPVSMMSTSTVRQVDQHYAGQLDYRRFRQNVIIEADEDQAYIEDRWVNQTLQFGEGEDCSQILLHRPAARCPMVNVDPDSAAKDSAVLKAVNRSRDNCLGMYAWPRKIGFVRVGDPVLLIR